MTRGPELCGRSTELAFSGRDHRSETGHFTDVTKVTFTGGIGSAIADHLNFASVRYPYGAVAGLVSNE